MVANRRLERHPGVEQRFVRLLELGAIVSGGMAVVDVVAEHEDQVERELLPPHDHLLRHGVLRFVAAPRVTDDCKPDRTGLLRQRQLARRRLED